MDKKEIIKAVEILIAHNEWRRGADTPHTNPKELGDAIDTVVKALSQPKEVDLEELRDEFKKRFFTPHTPTETERRMTLVFDWCTENLLGFYYPLDAITTTT